MKINQKKNEKFNCKVKARSLLYVLIIIMVETCYDFDIEVLRRRLQLSYFLINLGQVGQRFQPMLLLSTKNKYSNLNRKINKENKPIKSMSIGHANGIELRKQSPLISINCLNSASILFTLLMCEQELNNYCVHNSMDNVWPKGLKSFFGFFLLTLTLFQ